MPESLAASISVVQDPVEDFATPSAVAAAGGLARIIYRAALGGYGLAMLRVAGDVRRPLLSVPGFMGLNSHCVDGRQTMVTIKTDDGLNEIPMAVLTTSINPKDVAFCHQAGADAYHVRLARHNQYLLPVGSLMPYRLESATLHTDTVKVD
jgi:CheY-like chemotaxis protein